MQGQMEGGFSVFFFLGSLQPCDYSPSDYKSDAIQVHMVQIFTRTDVTIIWMV
jgi:hypothetical protein